MRNQNWTIWITPGAFLVWIITMIISAKQAGQVAAHLSKTGVLTSGVVAGRRTSTCSEIPCYFVSYRFTLSGPQGKTQYSKESPVSEAVYNALKNVRFVGVRYLKDDPHISCLELECAVKAF